MKVGLAAVTGGTGFLGRVVSRLLADEGWHLRHLARTPREGITDWVEGSLSDQEALDRLVAGADLVVHMAALTKSPDAKGFHLINIGGSRRLARAIRAHAPKAKVVVVSSLAAREPGLSPYAASKAASEVALLECPGPVTILRPCALYGPGDPAGLPLFRMAQWPALPFPNHPDARLALLHVDDAARAVVAACRAESGFWEVGEGAYGWARIVRAAANAQDRDPALLPLPDGVLSLALGVARRLKPGVSPLASPGKLEEMLHDDWTCDPARLPPSALWRPFVALDEGFRQTAEWYRSRGWL